MNSTRTWSPFSHIIDGSFATTGDLLAAIDTLREKAASRVIVATFSGRWLIPSLSHARSEDEEWNDAVVELLERKCSGALGEQPDGVDFVAKCVMSALEEADLPDPSTLAFGGNLKRPGGIAVVVGGCGLTSDSAAEQAELIAACVFASRPAAFSLDTSLELAVLSELRQASEHARPASPSLTNRPHQDTTKTLLRFASETLHTAMIVVYEADESSPHRFTYLDRTSVAPSRASQIPAWMPSRVTLTDPSDVPAPPERGGSEFESLGPFIDHCFSSKGRPRRLVGVIAQQYRAYGVPFGFDDVRRRAAGVLCLIWEHDDERYLDPYELAATRMIVSHLARSYDTHHSARAVGLVTGQLSAISNDPRWNGATEGIACDPMLTSRRDIRQIAPSVGEIVNGLVSFSGAMSVTCRLLSGAEGPSFTRALIRLHSEDKASGSRSPHRIALDNAQQSVNAWVATRGQSVYLRALVPDEEAGYYTSSDLAFYDGLDRVPAYRENVQCELCVPIFAEGRVVGTVNLEAEEPYAFDSVAETVAEYAQLIGVALLEARRRIGVDTVTEVDGIMTYRHQLESELEELADQQVDEHAAEGYREAVKRVKARVFGRRMENVDDFGRDARVSDAIAAGMSSLKWATRQTHIQDLTLGSWTEATASVYSATIGRDAARALAFAVAQALHNVRKYGGTKDALANRQYSAMLRFGEIQLGGRRTLFIAISSTCLKSALDDIDPQQVFREPIARAERLSIGAFLAGEALRRCGGAAYLRVTPGDAESLIIDAEFSVPAI